MSLPHHLLLVLISLFSFSTTFAQIVNVTAQVQVAHPGKQKKSPAGASGVVVWLTPVTPSADNAPARPGHYRLVQKDKQFSPHLLVVGKGSSIQFPNLDPFFHNVFSQFNGKRFDLGLYEAGASRTLRFDQEGVSYIFCNIHPEMSAVIITLATPYVAVSTSDGSITLHDVPENTYEMKVWAEGADPKQLDALSQRVHISPSQNNLGVLHLEAPSNVGQHKNKFGEDYKSPDSSLY